MIHKLLIANRGEIARRIARTCRSLGIRTVAVFSDADAALPFVREADEAVRIGPAPVSESYLDPARILDAARRTGADAVHPGYGFLSERAAFAEAVVRAGLTWIGPPPSAIAAMGDKAAARRLVAHHGVPIVPGYDGPEQDDATLAAEAARIGVPLLVKASAGGGGRGMRRVDDLADLPEALASARREATSAFGDGTLLLERYVTRPRHVEVQILADAHGNTVHLFERECSVQRRHQKVLEEAPSPGVDDALRERLGVAAVLAAEAVDYVGAGTVEFLLDPDGEFYFLEMNTRLQVEHPVTEEITGHDLVALQIAVAEGRPLPFAQEALKIRGHAIEARLYAEDANRDYLPSSGTLLRLDLPASDGTRIDSGYETGSQVGVHYDPMLAKLIAWGPDRATATRRLRSLVERAWAPGVVTNLPLLRQVLAHPAWVAGELHTGFLPEHGIPVAPPLNLARGALATTALAWARRRDASPWPAEVRPGFRVEGGAQGEDVWACGTEEVRAVRRSAPDGIDVEVTVDGTSTTHALRAVHTRGDALSYEVDGVRSTVRVAVRQSRHADAFQVQDDDVVYVHLGDGEAMLRLVPRFPPPKGADVPAGSCVAPTPGTVTALHVAVGDTVSAGARLATLEAMKMEHVLTAPESGTVAAVHVDVGDTVEQGAILLRVDPTA